MNRKKLAALLRRHATRLDKMAWKLEAYIHLSASGQPTLTRIVREKRLTARSLRRSADQLSPKTKR